MVGEVLRPSILVLPILPDAQVTSVTSTGEKGHFFIKGSDATVKFKKTAAIEEVAYV